MLTNKIIREKRKELGLTQEQVASYLGVSTPAVNKWESGATYPDIALLPALARLLKTDINTLLCFNEGLSEQEINRFCKKLSDVIQENGFEAGYNMGVNKIKEYPSCAPLIYFTAMVLDGALMMSGMSAEDKEKYSADITSLYERAANCGDEKIKNPAVYMLAAKYMSQEDYIKVQELLDVLPERSALDKKRLQAQLWVCQGKHADAAEILERELLLPGINEIQITLIVLAEIAIKEGHEDDAAHLAKISRETAKLFDLWGYYSFVAPLQVALAQENIVESLSLLKSLLTAALTPWDLHNSILYRHMASGVKQHSAGLKMLPGLLWEIKNDPKYNFLHSNTEFQKLVEQYASRI